MGRRAIMKVSVTVINLANVEFCSFVVALDVSISFNRCNKKRQNSTVPVLLLRQEYPFLLVLFSFFNFNLPFLVQFPHR